MSDATTTPTPPYTVEDRPYGPSSSVVYHPTKVRPGGLEGEILTPDEVGVWEYVRHLEERVTHLEGLIGERPEDSHPDDWQPRGESWHAERQHWAAEVAVLRAEVARLAGGPPPDNAPQPPPVPAVSQPGADAPPSPEVRPKKGKGAK